MNNYKGLLYAICLLAFPTLLCAQFSGGRGDGFIARLVIQLDLTGAPVGVRPLYAGGPSDGFDQVMINATISGEDLAQIFAGGSGDGSDQFLINATISGQSLAELFHGGSGDGFDREAINVTISGASLSQLYAGGSGDGFDRGAAAGALNGFDISGIFTGGSGDGFSDFSFGGSISGATIDIYAGGAGDGFDEASGNFSLSGQSLATLFAGGRGDGFDTETYFGVLPLPLTLISFDAIPKKGYVLLEWTTENEVATDFFTIEKTRDGQAFATVGNTAAAGDAEPSERLYYDMEDRSPYTGTSFYRLKTTDFDGAISLSHLVEVEYATADGWDFALFPNPNTGRQLGFRPEGLEDGEQLSFEVLDVQGRALLNETFATNGGDHQFQLTTKLATGSYLIRVTDEKGGTRAKILIVQ